VGARRTGQLGSLQRRAEQLLPTPSPHGLEHPSRRSSRSPGSTSRRRRWPKLRVGRCCSRARRRAVVRRLARVQTLTRAIPPPPPRPAASSAVPARASAATDASMRTMLTGLRSAAPSSRASARRARARRAGAWRGKGCACSHTMRLPSARPPARFSCVACALTRAVCTRTSLSAAARRRARTLRTATARVGCAAPISTSSRARTGRRAARARAATSARSDGRTDCPTRAQGSARASRQGRGPRRASRHRLWAARRACTPEHGSEVSASEPDTNV